MLPVIRDGCDPGTSIGNPSPTMNVWVDAPPGESGEIIISGSTVMLGYLEDIIEEEIRFAAVTDVRTADEGYVGDEGEIHLLGRKDHLISLHGVKLHPSEIELPVNQLPGVKDSLAKFLKMRRGTRPRARRGRGSGESSKIRFLISSLNACQGCFSPMRSILWKPFLGRRSAASYRPND